MAKKNPSEENVLEENLLEEDFDEEDFGEVVVEMTDDDGNSYFYTEQMIIPVGDDDFALLVEVNDPKHEHEHCEHHHEHEHEHEGCGCGCGCEEGDVIIAKIVTDPETGDDIYIEPTDEEFEAVQKVYEEMIAEDEDEF